MLQVKMVTTVRHEFNFHDSWKGSEVEEVEESWEADVDTYEGINDTESVSSTSVYQPHRIVHLSELEGLDMRDVVQDAEKLGLIDDQNG